MGNVCNCVGEAYYTKIYEPNTLGNILDGGIYQHKTISLRNPCSIFCDHSNHVDTFDEDGYPGEAK